MTTELLFAGIAATVAVVGTLTSLGITVFNAGTIKGRIDALGEKLAEAVAEMRESRAEKQKTAAHEVRIGQLEKAVEALAKKLSVTTLQAVHPMRPRSRSRPDMGGNDD